MDDRYYNLNNIKEQTMINSYFRTINTHQPSSYGTSRLQTEKSYALGKHKKYKLFTIILARATSRTLRLTFQAISQSSQIYPAAVNKLVQYSEKNASLSLFLALEKIKNMAARQRSEEKLLKNAINLLQRMQKYKLKQAFSRITLAYARKNTVIVDRILGQRVSGMIRKLAVLVRRQKKYTMDKLGSWSRFIKSYSKLRVLGVIRSRLERTAKQLFFSRMHRFLLRKQPRTGGDRQVGQLRVQLQDLTVQLQNKKQSIQRLETEISQLKVDQSNISFNQNHSYREYSNHSRPGVYKTYSQKKLSFNEKSIQGSNEDINLNDVSLGSILGGLNRSRTGSASKMDSGCECSCGFRAKYLKYKNLNESLKNQLQIVKEELQVAKDLNEHFTNEIKQYLAGEGQDCDVQKLKKEQQTLLKERDELRDKVFKYQKHINNLKAEFKVKMQQLYRKVRKEM